MKTWATIQGVYFMLTGVWPLVSIRTFQMVTGPKTDLWLVKTVGALILIIGAVILFSGISDSIGVDTLLLAVGSAVALCIVDVNYSIKSVISKIYLLDAAIEIVLIGGWITCAVFFL